MIRYLFHKALGHRVRMPGAGEQWFYRCATCSRGWGHKCTRWCGFEHGRPA